MSDAQNQKCHVGSAECHFGCTGVLTEIHESSLKVVRCWYGTGPMRISQPVPAPRYSRATPRQTSKPFIKIVPILFLPQVPTVSLAPPIRRLEKYGE